MIHIPGRFDRMSKAAVIKGAVLAALILSDAAAAAQTTDLIPMAARRVKLGPISALTYYTVEMDGFRVVTTIQADDVKGDAYAMPTRFVVTLAPGQQILVSVPRNAGMDAVEFKIARVGDAIEISPPSDRSMVDRR